MRILAIGAHPDDLELLCGGTLARCVARGDYVVMAHACNGNKGHASIPPEQLAATRAAEAAAAARVIGAEPMGLGFPDAEIYLDHSTTSRFVDAIRTARPDVIITHDPGDYHADHTTVTQLVLAASYVASTPNYETGLAPHSLVPPVYFMDTLAGINFSPTEYVDITDVLAIKKQAMRQHASQLRWISDQHSTDVLEFLESVARFRGLQCGVRYAEGFRCAPAWGRLAPHRWLP